MEKKILFVTTGLDYGGAEIQLIQLAQNFSKRDWKVSIVSMLPPNAFVDELAENGISVESLGMTRKVPDPRALLKLMSVIDDFNPTVLHGHMVHANIISRIANFFKKVPVVINTAHSIDEGGRFRELLYRITDSFCDLTTQVSREGVKRYIDRNVVPINKIKFVPNGIDLEKFVNTDKKSLPKGISGDDTFKFLAIGRLEEPKDYFNMLSAFAKLEKSLNASLYIVGQGSLEHELYSFIEQNNMKDNVHLLGLRNDITDLLNVTDAFVMSSAWEGTPMVLLEAAACEVPIVATNVGGIPDVVLDNKTGYLVPPNNPLELSKAIEKMLVLSYPDRIRMGKLGREHVVNYFDLKKVIEVWEQLYKSIFNGKS